MKTSKGIADLPINITFNLLASVIILLVSLTIIVPLIMNMQEAGGCVGLLRWVGSVLADAFGFSIC